MKIQVPEKLAPFLQKKKRFKVAFGGRGSGKSMTFADLCLLDCMTKGIKTACFREFQNSIDDSVLALLGSEIQRLELPGFEIQSNKIKFEGQDAFKFSGLARNPEGIKSAHGFQRFWVEEAQTISYESLRILTPTLRTEESEIWFSANLRSKADPFSQRFFVPYEKELRSKGYYEDDLRLIVWINYNDNPFFPSVLNYERLDDKKRMSAAEYAHTWLGETYDEVDGSIIPVEWFEAAIDAHEKLGFKGEGAIIASFDPSDEGGDAKGLAVRHGSVVLDVQERKIGDVNDGCDWAVDEALRFNSDHFIFDGDGLGIGLKRQVDQALSGKKVDYHIFKGSSGVDDPDLDYIDSSDRDSSKRKTNKDTFLNKRAQYYWKLRDRFYNTYRAVEKGEYINPDDMISLSSSIENLEQLKSEVCRIPLKRNNNGKIQIMSKLDMSKKPYQLPSPNMADSLMMSMIAPQPQAQNVTLNFTGWGG